MPSFDLFQMLFANYALAAGVLVWNASNTDPICLAVDRAGR